MWTSCAPCSTKRGYSSAGFWTRRYPPLSYCVQYRETDYEFVTRLMREAGVFFFFEPPASLDGAPDADKSAKLAPGIQETVVITDSVRGYPAIEAGPGTHGDTSVVGAVLRAAGERQWVYRSLPGGAAGPDAALAIRYRARSGEPLNVAVPGAGVSPVLFVPLRTLAGLNITNIFRHSISSEGFDRRLSPSTTTISRIHS